MALDGAGSRYGYMSPEEYIAKVNEQIRGWLNTNSYQRGTHEDQPYHIELWCEATGMVPQASKLVSRYGIKVWSGRGYDSVSFKKEFPDMISERDVPTVGLHIGDFDDHGMKIYNALVEDVESRTSADH